MNREDAFNYIDEHVGIYADRKLCFYKSAIKNVLCESNGLSKVAAFKNRAAFVLPQSDINNSCKLPPCEVKPPLPQWSRPPKYEFAVPERKIIKRAEYLIPEFAVGLEIKPILQLRSGEKYVNAIVTTFDGSNVTGKLAETLNKRIMRLRTQAQEQDIRLQREEERNRRAEERRAAAKAERKKNLYGVAGVMLAYFSPMVAVVAVLCGFALNPIVMGESGSKVYYGFVFAAFAILAAASLCNMAAKNKSSVFNKYTLIACLGCAFVSALFYPLLRLNKYVTVIITVCLAPAFAVLLIFELRKNLKDRNALKSVLVNCAAVAFTVIVCVQLGVKTFDSRDYDGRVDDNIYYSELNDGNISVTVSKFGERLQIPRVVNGKTVSTVAGHSASGNRGKLKSLVLPDTVESVSTVAFDKCRNLASVTAPARVLDDLPLDGVTEVTVNGGETLDFGKLNSAKNLVTVNLGDSVKTIGDRAFSRCFNLYSVHISAATHIGRSAFGGCYSLESVDIPDTVTEIDEFAFTNCTALTAVYLPRGITQISMGLFNGCTSLQWLEIPYGVTTVQSMAFNNCRSLNSLVIPDTVTEELRFSDRVFENVNSLASLTAPAELLTLLPRENLTVLHVTGKVIPHSALFACRNLQVLDIRSGVTDIGERAFQGCKSLTSVSLPNSVTTIGQYAFAGCSSLTKFDFPPNITAISGWIFEWCTALESVYIPQGVTQIDAAAFWGCESLKQIQIPQGVTAIGDGAFAHCKSLTEASLPSGITNIEKFTFAYCTNLKNVTLPAGVTAIGENAFTGSGVTVVDYGGSRQEWESVILGDGNEPIVSANKNFA